MSGNDIFEKSTFPHYGLEDVMTDRERLLALLEETWIDFFKYEPVYQNSNTKIMTLHIDKFVDFLLANGVTFATDTNDGGKWISVSERLPEPKLNVLVYGVSGGGEIPSVHSGYTRGVDEGWFTWEDSKLISNVTHWQPMPQPPRGE